MIFKNIQNCVVEKKYDVQDEHKIYKPDEFKNACNTLKIEYKEDEKIFFSVSVTRDYEKLTFFGNFLKHVFSRKARAKKIFFNVFLVKNNTLKSSLKRVLLF